MKNKSLETSENSSVITIFTSDNLFLKLAFILSLKPSYLTPDFILTLEWIVFPHIFTADMPVGPKRRTRGKH